MRLQSKLTLAFAVALLPIAALAAVARLLVAEQYRAQFRRELDEAQAEAERAYRRLSDDVVLATKRIARIEDPTIGRLLVEIGKGGGDDERSRELARHVELAMRPLGFDVLELVDERGQVLAAGHFPGRFGDPDPQARERGRKARGVPHLTEERVVLDGAVQTILALEVAERVEARFSDGPPVAVTVVGGKRLGPSFLSALHHEASLLAPDGTVLVGRTDRPPSYRRWPRRLVELRAEGPESPVLARLEIVVPDEELAHTLALLGWASAAMGLGALALALLLGFFMARRMTRPLDELASGAQAVARGRLDVQVGVGRKDEIGELAEAFNEMTRDLTTAREELVRAERVAAWREIAQRIAHEIKNPLTPIQMAIETLQRARDKDPRLFNELFAESSRTILDEVSRLKSIVGEFSRFARLPAPNLQPVDVTEVVEATLTLYAGGPAVEKSLEPRLRALADRDQLVQVLLNLLENARDAVQAASEPRIRVTTRAAGELVELEVADSGPGLSDEVRAKIFTPYFTTKPKGTGLGLAIVHRIVSDHGGEIRVASNEGAVFVVSLRRAPVAEAA